MQLGDLVLNKSSLKIGLIVSKNKAKKTWHKKAIVMWADGSLETVKWLSKDLEKI